MDFFYLRQLGLDQEYKLIFFILALEDMKVF